MADLKDDLAALRIERDPVRPGSRRWVGWVIVLVVLSAIGAGAWRYFTRERPIEVSGGHGHRARGGHAGRGAERLRLRHGAAARDGVVEDHGQGHRGERRGGHGRERGPGARAARRLDVAGGAGARGGAGGRRAAGRAAKTKSGSRRRSSRSIALTQLLKDGFATQADVDGARADVDSTEARIVALKQQVNVAERQIELQQTDLDNTIIRAPFSGIAISKDAQPGEMVSPVSAGGGFTRTGICTIVDMHSLEIEVDVNESYINRVTPGQDVTAVLDAYPDWQIPAHVITIVPTADRQKATVLVRIAFKKLDPRILPDMGIKVTFLRERRRTRAAPRRRSTRSRSRSCRRPRSRPTATATSRSSSRARSSSGGPCGPAAPTATASRCSPGCTPAIAWCSRRPRS